MELIFVLILTLWLLLVKWGRHPSISDILSIVSVVNSRGGNILVLGGISLYFFTTAVRMFQFSLHEVAEKRLTPDNAVLMMGLQFVTGVAFGGAFGAMLKAMTGGDSSSRNGDGGPSATLEVKKNG